MPPWGGLAHGVGPARGGSSLALRRAALGATPVTGPVTGDPIAVRPPAR
ncbi:hypothetical protein Lokhon_01415 [Limimaricola hongkongensis DSM 17492]|uniref:Uncharacterized protein n=1 Tax=Limimaricola hongkongensis DSM 17492 TaxID=1122180 RepID=A0A017HFR5_9RHOB|nr:hypothetical protein Lokhon_01415 [Limimaricola hongkongensis DSM 17492]